MIHAAHPAKVEEPKVSHIGKLRSKNQTIQHTMINEHTDMYEMFPKHCPKS